MSEGVDSGQLAPDEKGCVSEEHVAQWFTDARAQGYTFKELENQEALITGRDGKSRKIWANADGRPAQLVRYGLRLRGSHRSPQEFGLGRREVFARR
jgi:hypothetical protein